MISDKQSIKDKSMNDEISSPNDLALPQPPSGAVRDSENNQAAQTAETGIQGGCWQQRLVLPWDCAEFTAFMPMGWGQHLYVQWLAKTNNQPSVDSMCSYLANLCEIGIVILGSLPSSTIEHHYLHVARHLRSHANFVVPAPLAKALEKSPLKSLVEAALSGRHTDIDTVALQIARETVQKYETQCKLNIPYRPTLLCPEMGSLEVPLSLRASVQAREPSENKCVTLVADVSREFLEQSLREMWVRQNDLALAQTPEKSASDTPRSQVATQVETDGEGGCCQQRLVLPWFIGNKSQGESSFSVKGQGSGQDYVEIPWLSLLMYLPLWRAVQGQPELVPHYVMRRDIHDNLGQFSAPEYFRVSALKERLKEIFPHSFLFQSYSSQIQYRNDRPRDLSLETLEILYQQIPSVDLLGPIDMGKTLGRLCREAWRCTQTPIQHNWLALAGDDFAVTKEEKLRLTWIDGGSGMAELAGQNVKRTCADS